MNLLVRFVTITTLLSITLLGNISKHNYIFTLELPANMFCNNRPTVAHLNHYYELNLFGMYLIFMGLSGLQYHYQKKQQSSDWKKIGEYHSQSVHVLILLFTELKPTQDGFFLVTYCPYHCYRVPTNTVNTFNDTDRPLTLRLNSV